MIDDQKIGATRFDPRRDAHQQALGVPPVVADDNAGDHGRIVGVMVVHLSGGDVELAVKRG